MEQIIELLYSVPVVGLVFQLIGYLIDILPSISPIILRVRPDRTGRLVRRPL